jgi:hypothetical protein
VRHVAVLCVAFIAAASSGCGVWTSYQSVAVEPAQRPLRWGAPDNGLRMGIEVKQDTDRQDDGLVMEDCRFRVDFELVPPRVPAVARGEHEHVDAPGGGEGGTWLVVGGSREWKGTTKAMTVALTLPTGERYTLPQGAEGRLFGLCNVPQNGYTESFDLTDIANRFKSPETATLTVTYHLDPDPADPDRWSGTITTPPIRVRFYRMKSWSLLG